MTAPAWLTGVFAAPMLTVAVYCAGRLIAARRWRRPTEVDTDAGHVVMGVAMAGMLVARLRIVPAAGWEAVFAVGAAWFIWQLLRSRGRTPASPWRCPHPAPHLVECAAMVFPRPLLFSTTGPSSPVRQPVKRAQTFPAGALAAPSACSGPGRRTGRPVRLLRARPAHWPARPPSYCP